MDTTKILKKTFYHSTRGRVQIPLGSPYTPAIWGKTFKKSKTNRFLFKVYRYIMYCIVCSRKMLEILNGVQKYFWEMYLVDVQHIKKHDIKTKKKLFSSFLAIFNFKSTEIWSKVYQFFYQKELYKSFWFEY